MYTSNRTLRVVLGGFSALVLTGLFSLGAFAAGKGSEGKGRYYFRQTCKECHTKGAKGGEVTPLTKTMAQWSKFFVKGNHTSSEPLSKLLNEQQLLDVQTFLVKHAADSLQPETCGK